MIPWLHNPNTPFPPTDHALPATHEWAGLLAAGDELTPARLAAAYTRGIFPWYGPGQPVLWWATDPRMVLPAAGFRLHRSLRQRIRRDVLGGAWRLTFDDATPAVIAACASVPRTAQEGTWIGPDVVAAYSAWPAVHSIAVWQGNERIGGLYGVQLGRMWFGESMFTRATDASKVALAALVAWARAAHIPLIDCQQQTSHLASLGATTMARASFEAHLRIHVNQAAATQWAYDPDHWALIGV